MDEPKVRRTLYGSETTNTAGFCCKHYRSLTPNQIVTRQCLGKDCRYLVRHEHPFWEERAAKRKQRKDRKAKLEARYQEAICNTNQNRISR